MYNSFLTVLYTLPIDLKFTAKESETFLNVPRYQITRNGEELAEVKESHIVFMKLNIALLSNW